MNSILGEIRLFSFDFAPEGWMECAGQTLQVTEYSELFSLIGTKYGGSGMTSFCLPNLASIGQASAKVKYFIAVDGEYPPR
jgi:microcystin-dependent protein